MSAAAPNLRHDELRAILRYKGVSQAKVAAMIGISTVALTLKLRGDIPWKLEEVYRIGSMLDIPKSELLNYFPRPY